MSKTLKLKPYARLLTMLGDQLIRNEQVALSELIKNAYDADASWVKVTFDGFDADYKPRPGARIVIEDDGHGMSAEVIEQHWVNPATPVKRMGKKNGDRETAGGRIIQGEKGIGRFALLKIGRDVHMTTRPIGADEENIVDLRLGNFDEDFIADDDRAMFLDELNVELETVPAKTIVAGPVDLGGKSRERRPHGTRIEISPPLGRWSPDKVDKVFDDLSRLQTIFDAGVSDVDTASSDVSEDAGSTPVTTPSETDAGDDAQVSPDPDFAVYIYRNEEYQPLGTARRGQLDTLLQNNTVFRIEGRYDEDEREFDFSIGKIHQKLSLTDPALTGLRVFRDYLETLDLKVADVETLRTECGSFSFSFYVFDFSNDATGKRELSKPDKDLIKKHRIYLYRDGIRVYPYGDPDDDWLLIDVRRGTVKASEFLSNDQVVGHVNISQEDNPNLRDKTSREGLVDTGRPVDDFRSLLQIFLAWVRAKPFANYKQRGKTSNDVEVFRTGKVQELLDEAATAATADGVPKAVAEKLSEVGREYKAERRYLVQRAENTEHLAGVGLSVEAASHDLMIAMGRAIKTLDKLSATAQGDAAVDKESLGAELMSVRGLLSFIESQLKDMQLLFRSTKQRRKAIRVSDLVEKVTKIFQSLLVKHSIDVEVDNVGSPLVAKTTDAVLLQLLLNLFDNAIYWLQSSPGPRKIEIQLNGDEGTMTFADNGPGFRDEDIEYVFEPFYSGKGEEGRGLGLYIARQLLERHDYTIEIAEKDQRILKGANLVVSLVRGEE
ncbi:MAG: sensor histidine kinase [Brevundimonas sp.]|nr:MAG: sensor histidine kinase [Brevundimonas sp.]